MLKRHNHHRTVIHLDKSKPHIPYYQIFKYSSITLILGFLIAQLIIEYLKRGELNRMIYLALFILSLIVILTIIDTRKYYKALYAPRSKYNRRKTD